MTDPDFTGQSPPATVGRMPGDTPNWQDLLSRVSAEVAAPLSAALERIETLTTTGQIDRKSLQALLREVKAAREAGMIGQQIARFASGHLRQSYERLHLGQVLQSVLTLRARELQGHGARLKPVLKPVEVVVDAALLSSLLNALLDWALATSTSEIEFRIEMKSWPANIRLVCSFLHSLPAESSQGDLLTPTMLDSLSWQLLMQTAKTMGLDAHRVDSDARSTLTLEFPRKVNDEMEGVTAIELDEDSMPASPVRAKTLVGSHVLVLSPRREIRSEIRDAVRHMGLIIDFVNSVDEAIDFCNDGLPHAIVYEAALRGERMDRLRGLIETQAPSFVFIEVVEDGNTFEVSSFSDTGIAQVGRAAIMRSLPSALVFELSKEL